MKTLLFSFLLVSSFSIKLQGQNPEVTNRIEELRTALTLSLADNPGLEKPVDLSVSKAPLGEFIRALGIKNKVNLSVDQALEGVVSNTFSQVTVMDVLLFLAEQYELDFNITGGIIHVFPYQLPEPSPPIKIPRSIKLYYDLDSNTISMELSSDSLAQVAKALSQQCGINVVYAPGAGTKQLDFYVEEVPLDQAMDKLAFANNLIIEKTEDDFYLVSLVEPQNAKADSPKRSFLKSPKKGNYALKLDSGLISIEAHSVPLSNVLFDIFDQFQIDYFLFSPVQGDLTLRMQSVSLESFLNEAFKDSPFTYRVKDSLYLIGENESKGMLQTKNLVLRNRTVEKVIEYIPSHLKSGLEIKEAFEMNSLLVAGPYPLVRELEQFIETIDKPVPMVLIEVIIVDYQRSYNVASGIDVGVGADAPNSGGSVYPGLDYTLNANSLNQIIQSFNGFGSLNLGPVTPNFYVNLQLLESNGILNVRSTPKLSTLNGHEASISIGNTEYYVVEQTNIQGVQNPIPITTRNYQSVQANFSLNILPMVSADDQVTLVIDVEQSDFTGRIAPEAPPGNVSRKFSSVIRVKGEEVVLLGGLEEKSSEDSGSGVPLISRVPILRWFFSSRNRVDSKSRLSVFIKPTIIY